GDAEQGQHQHRRQHHPGRVRGACLEGLQTLLRRRQTRLMARLFRYSSGFAGSNTLPSKNFSTPRDVVFGICATGTLSSFAAARHRSSRLTFEISVLKSSLPVNLPHLTFSVRNHNSWLW